MKKIQQNILEYIENEDNSEDNFKNIKDILSKDKIKDNKYEFESFLYLLSKLSDNYHRSTYFFNKISKILEYLKDDLRKSFSSSELFHIFESNKRILLFLIEEKLMIVDKWIATQIMEDKHARDKYALYFKPEIQPFFNKKRFSYYERNWFYSWISEFEKEIPADFYELRKIGENDSLICELIRKDSFDGFIVCMNKNNIQFDSTINRSIYETNNFLLKKENYSLIEYAAFFGSIQIFNYLRNKGVKLTPSLWHYAIHGNNAEIIQILEDNKIKPIEESYEEIMKESIKCHHNDIADYIQTNYLAKENEEESKYEVVNGIKYHNFKFINNEQINETTFNYLCKYDYYTLVSILLNTTNLDINQKTIYKIINFNSILKFEIMNDIYIKKS